MTNWRLVVANGLLLCGITAVLGIGTETRATELLRSTDASDGAVSALESQAATAPTPSVVAELASAYLDRRQPGLSLALIDRASSEIQDSPEVAIAHARAAFAMGEPERALALVREVQARCGVDAIEADPRTRACPTWISIRASLQRDFLEEILAAGITDPEREPAATMAAYRRSAREVRLAMR